MKKIIIILILITGCKSQLDSSNLNNKNEWITAYKKYVIFQTIKKTKIDLNKDNSGAIQFEILGTNPEVLKEIDSLSNKYSQSILSSPSYFEGKPTISMILNIYTSRELDIIANNSYKKREK